MYRHKYNIVRIKKLKFTQSKLLSSGLHFIDGLCQHVWLSLFWWTNM